MQRNKWAPFQSILHTQEVLDELREEKSKVRKPILSEEMKSAIEEMILESYTNQTPVEITYYYKEHLWKKTGVITKIDPTTKKITLNQDFVLYFSNIVHICEKTLEK